MFQVCFSMGFDSKGLIRFVLRVMLMILLDLAGLIDPFFHFSAPTSPSAAALCSVRNFCEAFPALVSHHASCKAEACPGLLRFSRTKLPSPFGSAGTRRGGWARVLARQFEVEGRRLLLSPRFF